MFQKVTGMKLYEGVLERIKELIALGIYPKGTLLPSEKELIEMMGVSRITVREALRILAEVGIIQTIKGKGSIVAMDSSEFLVKNQEDTHQRFQNYRFDFEHSAHARAMLEPEIAKAVAEKATEEDILRLERCLLGETPIQKKEHCFEDFHRLLFQMEGNPIFISLYENLHDLEAGALSTGLTPPSKQKTIAVEIDRQHRKIFEAIKNHDSEFAYFYMKEHTLFLNQTYQDFFNSFFKG